MWEIEEAATTGFCVSKKRRKPFLRCGKRAYRQTQHRRGNFSDAKKRKKRTIISLGPRDPRRACYGRGATRTREEHKITIVNCAVRRGAQEVALTHSSRKKGNGSCTARRAESKKLARFAASLGQRRQRCVVPFRGGEQQKKKQAKKGNGTSAAYRGTYSLADIWQYSTV